MNKTSRLAATVNYQGNPFHLRACFLHCTPVSERRRRTHWDSATSFRSSPRKFNEYRKRLRKQSLLHNVSGLAEHLFQRWQSDYSDRDEHNQPSGRGSSWFRPGFREDGYRTGKSRNKTSRAFRRDFEFCDEDDEVEFETIFRSAFSGARGFYWSFTMDDGPRYRNSSSYSNSYRTSSRWKSQYDDESYDYDSSSDYEKPTVDTTSHRLALGLSSSGPLNLDDVKNAYRACALKWHPDRHQGSSKVVAEEKFKVCSAAYRSLCDKLSLH